MAADLEFWEPEDQLFPVSRSGKVKPCAHCRKRHRQLLLILVVVLSLLTGAGLALTTHPEGASFQRGTPVRAQLAASYGTLGDAVLNSAESRAGAWYIWGGAGPWVFDCSGLVVWAAARHGVYLPHSTYSMVSSPHLYRVYAPRRGDLAFFGTGHVELVTIWYHVTFGAHHSGTRVGWSHYDPRYYGPTAFYRLR